METKTRGPGALVCVALFVLTLAVTVGVMFLAVGAADRNAKFWLALGTLSWAECVGFGYLLLMSLRQDPRQGTLPVSFGVGVMIAIYVAGVAALALLAASHAGLNTLIVMHLVWILLLLVGVGGGIVGGSFAGRLGREQKEQRATHIAFKERLTGVLDQVALISLPAIQPLRDEMGKLREAATYATSESLPGSEAIEAEMVKQLGEIESKVQEMAHLNAALGTGPEAPKGNTEAVGSLTAQVVLLGQTLERRERLMAQLR